MDFSVACQASLLMELLKHISITLSIALTAIEAPGEAPNSAERVPSEEEILSVPELQLPTLFTAILDDLNPLPCNGQFPILFGRFPDSNVLVRQPVICDLDSFLH